MKKSIESIRSKKFENVLETSSMYTISGGQKTANYDGCSYEKDTIDVCVTTTSTESDIKTSGACDEAYGIDPGKGDAESTALDLKYPMDELLNRSARA